MRSSGCGGRRARRGAGAVRHLGGFARIRAVCAPEARDHSTALPAGRTALPLQPYRNPRMKGLLAALALSALTGLAGATGPQVDLHTNRGTITLELDTERAPLTVENFLAYVRAGHYDGTIFHRVIDGFMIQGGGFDASLRQRPTRAPIRNEAANGLRNVAGSIAMARTGEPHSATAQFFINLVDNPGLDHPRPDGHGYAVFGRV